MNRRSFWKSAALATSLAATALAFQPSQAASQEAKRTGCTCAADMLPQGAVEVAAPAMVFQDDFYDELPNQPVAVKMYSVLGVEAQRGGAKNVAHGYTMDGGKKLTSLTLPLTDHANAYILLNEREDPQYQLTVNFPELAPISRIVQTADVEGIVNSYLEIDMSRIHELPHDGMYNGRKGWHFSGLTTSQNGGSYKLNLNIMEDERSIEQSDSTLESSLVNPEIDLYLEQLSDSTALATCTTNIDVQNQNVKFGGVTREGDHVKVDFSDNGTYIANCTVVTKNGNRFSTERSIELHTNKGNPQERKPQETEDSTPRSTHTPSQRIEETSSHVSANVNYGAGKREGTITDHRANPSSRMNSETTYQRVGAQGDFHAGRLHGSVDAGAYKGENIEGGSRGDYSGTEVNASVGFEVAKGLEVVGGIQRENHSVEPEDAFRKATQTQTLPSVGIGYSQSSKNSYARAQAGAVLGGSFSWDQIKGSNGQNFSGLAGFQGGGIFRKRNGAWSFSGNGSYTQASSDDLEISMADIMLGIQRGVFGAHLGIAAGFESYTRNHFSVPQPLPNQPSTNNPYIVTDFSEKGPVVRITLGINK